MSVAKRVRQFWTDLFGSSLIERLNMDLAYLRSDFEKRLQERDQVIAELRAEKAVLNSTVALYQASINQRVGIDPARKNPDKPSFANFNSPPMKSTWQLQVEEHERENKRLDEEEAAAAAKKAGA